MEEDLQFISGDFFETDIPKDKKYLLKYFKTDLQLAFLKYYLAFGNSKNFIDHTGYYCSDRYVYKQDSLIKDLMKAYADARSVFDEKHMKMVFDIEQGKWKPWQKTKINAKYFNIIFIGDYFGY